MEEGKLVDLSASFEGFGDDYRFSAYQTLVTDNFEARRIKVKQNMSLGTGGILWDSAYVLSKYLDLYLGDLRSKKVIELGAGCALPSIIACSKGAEVVATDIEPTLSLTRTNLGANSALFSGTYSVHTLDWRHLEDVDSLPHTKYDLVLMSDVFYLPV
jgi:predicted nicotinamide N-methyase